MHVVVIVQPSTRAGPYSFGPLGEEVKNSQLISTVITLINSFNPLHKLFLVLFQIDEPVVAK